MTSDHDVLVVPRVSANDDSGLLIGWTKGDGEPVARDEVVCELEFSKSVFEMPSPRDGWLFHFRNAGEEVRVGAVFGAVSGRAERPVIERSAPEPAEGVKLTTKARKLIEERGLDVSVFQGIEIVKEQHVLAYLERQTAASDDSSAEGELLPLTAIRKRAAETLEHSKRTIPHSYLGRWLDAARVDARAAKLSADHDIMLSLSDLLVVAAAGAALEHPRARGSWRQNAVFIPTRINVGFAMNQPNGDLVVAVVHAADRMELDELVGRIRGLQKKAVRHKLTPEELTGAALTVTSLLGSGVHQVFPILVPGQSTIVALGDRAELAGRAVYSLTVAFDHRVLNGAEAAAYLAAVGRRLEGEESA